MSTAHSLSSDTFEPFVQTRHAKNSTSWSFGDSPLRSNQPRPSLLGSFGATCSPGTERCERAT
eukprot:6636907-Prymnesium_polylepis.1